MGKSESEVQARIAETAPLCEISSFREAAGKENLPAWSEETEQFEQFHEGYKNVVEKAEQDEISGELMTTALEQLASIEHLLVEKKQLEAEERLKESKKKKKGKKK